MTMRQILPCVLVMSVLTTVGCGFWDSEPETSQNPTSTPAADNRKKINFSDAEREVRDALKKMKLGAGSQDYRLSQVQTDVAAALAKLRFDDELATACACPEAIGEAKAAHHLLTTVSTRIGNSSKKVSELDMELTDELQSNLTSAADKLDGATRLASRVPSPSPTASTSVTSTSSAGETNPNTSSMLEWLPFVAKVFGGLLIVTLLVFGLLHLRNQSWGHLESYLGKAAAAQVSATRDAQKEILDKLSSLSSAQGEASGRLHDMHTEIRSLARMVRESSSDRRDGRSYAPLATTFPYNEPPPPKAEPDFPVSAVDYLGKMTRFANVVKPDFQNGILVTDPEGTGELLLIRDSRLPDETQPLFVVPRHAQFQTKQDFHTYYEKYYDCVRPSAGDVWIIDPAVVERVSGGWQLREKGVLEIR